MAGVMPVAVAVAELIVSVERQVKRNGKRLQALVDANGERIRELAVAYQVPGTVDIERGLVDMDLGRFGVGLVDRQQVPGRTNGYHHTDGGVPSSPPVWHPEGG
jgi:hypothetical protein